MPVEGRLARLIRLSGCSFRMIHSRGGPPPATLSRLCRGEAHWRPEWVRVVAESLGVPDEDITDSCRRVRLPRAVVRAEEEFVTTREAAALLHCSVSYLYKKSSVIQPMWLGGRRRYPRSSLVALAMKLTREGAG